MRDFLLHIDFNIENNLYFSPNSKEDEDYHLFLDGIILNKKQLINSYSKKNIDEVFKSQLSENFSFLDKVYGEFNGFFIDFRKKKVLIFINHQATRKVFYTYQKGVFICANSIHKITTKIEENQLKKTVDVNSLYSLLSVGNVLENNTIVNEIKRLHSCEYIEIDLYKKDISIRSYFDLSSINYDENKTLDTFTDEFNEVFKNAISQEYSYDVDKNKKSFSLLSGGLDSRVNIMMARKLGFTINQTMCFSQKDYFDHSISKKIASDFKIPYLFIPFDSIDFVKDIDKLSKENEFLSNFLGSSHFDYALSQVEKINSYTIIHSGQIGDGILGSFVSSKKVNLPNIERLFNSHQLKHKVKNYLENYSEKYEKEELFLLKNLAFNRTLSGSHISESHNTTLVSPFFHPEVMKLALSIPPKYKFNHRFYFYWINKHLPEATKYIWESTLLPPKNTFTKHFGEQILKRIHKYSWLAINRTDKISMVPYEYYFKKNKSLQMHFNAYFENSIDKLDFNQEIKSDVLRLFNDGNFYEKTMILTVLSSLNTLF
ncbi:MAG: hypothetical protein H6604_06460 [Flavobacteriales bacterium]|nr:hypothetical protein [Flavobacteriales bacterium]